MRKHSPRKWLHAVLDLLPVILIPVFMIYSRNENSTFSQEVIIDNTQTEYVLNTEYLYNSKPFTSFADWESSSYYWNYYWFDDLSLDEMFTNYGESIEFSISFYPLYNIDVEGDFYSSLRFTELEHNKDFDMLWDLEFLPFQRYSLYYIDDYGDIMNNFSCYVLDGDDPAIWIDYRSPKISNYLSKFVLNGAWFINVETMYGASYNDASLSKVSILGNHNVIKSASIEEVTSGTSITYNDTDIGSQFMYSLYNTTDKYFNFNNTFNFGEIWQWLNTNMFNGQAPLVAYVIWHIITYEFLMDLLMIIYTLFMLLIDFIDNFLDSVTCRHERRKH